MPKLRSQEDIEHGLAALVAFNGSERQAARWLEANGRPIPHQTLGHWKAQHAERLAELHERALPEIRQRIARTYENITTEAAEVALDAVHRAKGQIDDMSGTEAARAARELTTVSAISTDKALILRGEPTVRIQHTFDLDELWTRLTGRTAQEDPIDGQAAEAERDVHPRELVAGD